MAMANVEYTGPKHGLWFWDEIAQPWSYMARWGMVGWKWLG
jgi:hypothetical protein